MPSILLGAQSGVDVSPNTYPSVRGAVMVYHGLWQVASDANYLNPYNFFTQQLRNWGWHVVSVENAYTGSTSYLTTSFNGDGTGAAYLSSILAEWEDDVAAVQSVVGSLPVVVAGWSWGGLHALHSAASSTTKADAWAVHLPAADPNYLTEFSSYDLSALSDFNETDLAAQQGFCSYATDDTRVGYAAAQQLIIDTGCDSVEYTSLGHSTTFVTIQDMLDWFWGLSF